MILVSLCALSGLLFCGASALAFNGRVSVGSFTASSIPTGVAVDQEKGNVFVAESGAGVVAAFGPEGGAPSGAPAMTSAFKPTGEPVGVAIDNACWYHQPRLTGAGCEAFDPSNGDLYVANVLGNAIEKLALNKLSGAYEIVGAFPFKEPDGVAVDHEGNVYVADYFEPSIPVFNPSGIEIGKIKVSASPLVVHPAFIAVGSPGDVYVSNYQGGTAQLVVNSKYEVQSEKKLLEASGKAVALDASGNVLVDNGSSVSEYSPSRKLIGRFGQEEPGALTGSEGLAVNATTGKAYVSLRAGKVNIYGPVPVLQVESVSAVTAESVTFDATIDPPYNAPTTYYVQYGTTSAYGTSVPAPPGAVVGSGEGDVEVTQHVQGLQANTVYHYRVVAVSEVAGHVEEITGPDQTFTTQRSGGALVLPDGRSWELVTPPQKEGALFHGLGSFFEYTSVNLVQASAGGNAIADLASQPTEAEPQGYTETVSVLSTRGSGGWSSQVIAPPHDEGSLGLEGSEYRLFSEDLSRGIVQPFGPFTPLSPEASESTPYLHTDYLNGNVNEHCRVSCFQPLVTAGDTRPGAVFGEVHNGICKSSICGPLFVGASPDLSHVVVSSPVQLTSTPVHAEYGLYEWSGGHLQLVSVPPKSEEGKEGEFSFNLSGTENAEEQTGARRAISEDGDRVILSGRAGGLAAGLYLRDVAKSETVRLDVPQAGAKGTSDNPVFMTASTDASRVFFLDSGRLTAESSASGSDLYEYDLNAPSGSRLTDLTVDGHAGEAAGVLAVLGASDDGSYVYFAAGGALTPDAAPGKCEAREGNNNTEGCNVYVRHDGVTRLVAAGWIGGNRATDWSRVSPDGSWLAFMSPRSFTGYDTRDAVSGHPDAEVYLYDANAGRLVCASCDPTGARPVGVDVNPIVALWVAANVPGWTHFGGGIFGETRYQSRYLSDSGRLFFESNNALVPQDVNGAQDVYQYEPPGVGNCTTSSVTFGERSGGCVGLVSSGTSPEESSFLDASETGGDVFFLTQSKLVSQDFDSAFDVYDAHECTTVVPCYPVSPVSAPVCSTGDSCKAAPSPQPSIFGPAPSATFSGAGNVGPSASGPVVRGRSLTRAQKLTLALKACRKRARKRRVVCERNARKRYGTAAVSGKASAKRKGGR